MEKRLSCGFKLKMRYGKFVQFIFMLKYFNLPVIFC